MDRERGPPMLDDVLHPLSVLDWSRCHCWKHTNPTCCAVLKDIVCIVSRRPGVGDRHHILSTNSWECNTIPTNYEFSSITTFMSKFVSIGGINNNTHTVSPEVRLLDNYQQAVIPQMNAARVCVSSINIKILKSEYLVVAGGKDISKNPSHIVEVLVQNKWILVDDLPQQCCSMQCTIHEGSLYFLGDYAILTCKLETLYSRIEKSSFVQNGPLWYTITPDHHPITLVSYGNRLVSVDENLNIRGYNNIRGSWIEAVNQDIDGTVVSDKATSVVTSNGELIVAYGDDAVFKVCLSVSSFTPENLLIHGSLSRLEAAMRTDIRSQMMEFHYKRLAELNQSTVKDKNGSVIDPIQKPLEFVEEVVFTKYNNLGFSSTWQNLFDVLSTIDLNTLRKKIESFMRDETRYELACNYFIQNRSSLEMYFLKFIFVGPCGLGKTTTCRRLLGEILNLHELEGTPLYQPSTGVVEPKNIIIASTTSSISKSDWLTEINVQDEACIYLKTLLDACSSTTSSDDSERVAMPIEESTFVPKNASSLSQNLQQQKDNQSKLLHGESFSFVPSQEVPKSFSNLKDAAKESKYWKEDSKLKAHLRVEDTGGQPQLMDLLPSLCVSPGVFFLFVNLEDNLDKVYEANYINNSGKRIRSEHFHHSVKDVLMSELSSISSLNNAKRSISFHEKASNSFLFEKSKSVAYVIGTHKDKVSHEQIVKYDKELQEVLKNSFFKKNDVVQYCSNDQLIFALDNKKGGPEEITKLRQLLENSFSRHYKKLPIPISWLLFSISLQLENKKKLTYDFCLKRSKDFDILPSEIQAAMWFLHHHAGILMHFPDIPELKDLVILDNSIVYDSVTKIIVETMQSDEKVSQQAREDFKKMGIFSLDNISHDANETLQDCISPLELVAILEYVHIIARTQDKAYIMPCILQNLKESDLESISRNAHEQSSVAPIMISYKYEFIPLGVFPALIATVIGEPKKYNIQTFSENITKNKIVFYYGSDFDTVTLIFRPSYLELIINRYSTATTPIQKVCSGLKKDMKSILQDVNSRMNYKGFEDFYFGFMCLCNKKKDHICSIKNEDPTLSNMFCMKNKILIKLETKHKVWFQEIDEKHGSQFGMKLPQYLECCPTMSELHCLTWNDGKEHLHIIQNIATKWKELGDHIGLSSQIIQSIESHCHGKVEDCCRATFDHWLNDQPNTWTSHHKTWGSVIHLLQLMEENMLALIVQNSFTSK